MKNQYILKDFNPPLKGELPTFHFDLGQWCMNFLKIHPWEFPASLSDLHQRIQAYANQCPAYPSGQHPIRIYIIDHRLSVLLAMIDRDGEIANMCWRFAKYEHRSDDYILGSGDYFLGINPLENNGYNVTRLRKFITTYDISPVEILAVPTLLIFQGNELSDYFPLSTWQLCNLMHRFADKNRIDWEKYGMKIDEYRDLD